MDHYVAYMESEIRQLRLERDLLQARTAQQAAEVERLKAQVEKVREVCHRRAWWALQDSTSGLRTWVVYVDDIKRAMDGGAE